MDVLVGVLAVGEVYSDKNVIESYRSSRLGGSGTASVGLLPWMSVEAEIGYVSMGLYQGEESAGHFEMVPIAFTGCLRHDLGGAEVFGGAGPAITVFNETWKGQETDGGEGEVVGPTSGTKWGLDTRVGARIHTSLTSRSMRPGAGGLKGVDFELLLAHRAHHLFGVGDDHSLDLTAWRIGAGLVARL